MTERQLSVLLGSFMMSPVASPGYLYIQGDRAMVFHHHAEDTSKDLLTTRFIITSTPAYSDFDSFQDELFQAKFKPRTLQV